MLSLFRIALVLAFIAGIASAGTHAMQSVSTAIQSSATRSN
jgi:hypothetical protein